MTKKRVFNPIAEARRTMIIWTSVLVVGGGLLTSMTLLQPPHGLVESSYAPVSPNLSGSPRLGKGQRMPASISEAARKPNLPYESTGRPLSAKSVQQAIEFTLPCEDKKKGNESAVENSFATEARQVRLTGRSCQPKNEIASTEIRNETNGFSATIFPTSSRSFTTDYIALATGVNRIRILHIFSRGGREEIEWNVERK